MKRTLTMVAATVLIWSCGHKSTPMASKPSEPANTNAVVNTPSAPVITAAPAATTPVAPPDAATTKSPEMLGQATFTAKCGRCHGLKNTGDYTADRWVGIMQSMAAKAHLDDTEKENVLAYVKANAKK